MDKKVLIIAYYWPPSGGSGVQRWLKFVKYLPSFGWEPHVFTPENPSFGIRDESLLADVPPEAEVIRFPIWEPYDLFLKLSRASGSAKTAKPTELVSKGQGSWFGKMSTWMRGNLLIPDPRIFWVQPSVRFLSDYLSSNRIQTVITTGPPHSLHLIGMKLKKKNPALRWIADFRDPWSEWGLLDSLRVGRVARRLHRRLEKKVLLAADSVITITPFYVRQLSRLSGREITLITNGYDEDDFRDISILPSEKFIIRHVGIINEKCDPRPFCSALKAFISSHPGACDTVSLEFIGEVHPSFRKFISDDAVLAAHTRFAGNVPHKQLIREYGSSGLLLLILTGYKDAEGFLPGKLFEYLATGIPILGVGPETGDAAQVLLETESGIMISDHRIDAIQNYLETIFKRWQEKNPVSGKAKENRSRYSRRKVTSQLVQLLDHVV